jgi:hypothetical protein
MTALKIEVSEGTNFGKTAEEVLHTIDFSGWSLYPEQNAELMKALNNFAQSAMAEAIRNTWQWDHPEITFESDGVNIFVSMNIGSSCNDGRIWFSASISEMIDDYLWCTNPSQMAGGDEARTELAKTLRDCASKLEAAVGKEIDRKNDPSETVPAWAMEFAQELTKDVEERMRQALEKRPEQDRDRHGEIGAGDPL